MNEEQTDAVPSAPTRRSVGRAEHRAERDEQPAGRDEQPAEREVQPAERDEDFIEHVPHAEVLWAPPEPRRPVALGGWALAVAIIGLLVSLVVGWGFPVGLIAIITAITALRRPGDRRQAAGWALALGILSLVYSGIWIAVALNSGALV